MDYGFECDFEVKGDKEHVIMQFRQNSLDEHGIEYDQNLFKRTKWNISAV